MAIYRFHQLVLVVYFLTPNKICEVNKTPSLSCPGLDKRSLCLTQSEVRDPLPPQKKIVIYIHINWYLCHGIGTYFTNTCRVLNSGIGASLVNTVNKIAG